MKLALYGMPCAGKTTIISGLSGIRVLHGSKELQKLSGGSFSSLSEEEKKKVRISYTDYVNSLNDDMIISDGHFSFLREIVFTEADGELYDVFLYLYCEPKVLLERFKLSEKNAKYASLSEEIISQWQQFEIVYTSLKQHRLSNSSTANLTSSNGVSAGREKGKSIQFPQMYILPFA